MENGEVFALKAGKYGNRSYSVEIITDTSRAALLDIVFSEK